MSSILVQSVTSSGLHNLLEFYLYIVLQNIISHLEIFSAFLNMKYQGAWRQTTLRQAKDLFF
jgi:hypothetical protein